MKEDLDTLLCLQGGNLGIYFWAWEMGIRNNNACKIFSL
jgi:hypothetical protein